MEPVKADAKLPEITWVNLSPTVAVGTFVATQSLCFRLRDYDYFQNTAPGRI